MYPADSSAVVREDSKKTSPAPLFYGLIGAVIAALCLYRPFSFSNLTCAYFSVVVIIAFAAMVLLRCLVN